ncbi:hypothetical protein RvY_00223 [Ramazzottius varieornatus]|uniref:Uncharacterized protein n=1 Tax=Ramazzottius varieornatus TaxID=947166 RepID=A0A1D1UJE7_RAMVA|nr:hypothetical protein RvY_00223 [Ramazzottius varieornatus]
MAANGSGELVHNYSTKSDSCLRPHLILFSLTSCKAFDETFPYGESYDYSIGPNYPWLADANRQGENFTWNATGNPAYECVAQTTKEMTAKLQNCFNTWIFQRDQDHYSFGSFKRTVVCQPSSGVGLCSVQYGEVISPRRVKNRCESIIDDALGSREYLENCKELMLIKTAVDCVCTRRECKAPPARVQNASQISPTAALCGCSRITQSFITLLCAVLPLMKFFG